MASFCGILSLLCALLTVHSSSGQSSGAHYRGRYIGPLTPQKYKVSGEVYAVDARTLHIRGFTYDGTGPDAFFWTGFTEHPSSQGVIIPNERGTKEILGAYNSQDITISLPDGLTLRDIKWIAVWCRQYEVNFGDLYIPINLDFPQPHVVGSLVGQHGVSSGPIVVVDAQTILVPDFTYDGKAPDLHFWVGRGVPGPNGIRIPDETGTESELVKADKKTMVLSLPGDLTVFDIDYFGVWCRLYSIDFGHVRVTPGLNVPPSLRMLGVAPQSKLNCEVLHEDSAFEIRWSVVESGSTIVFQLVGRLDNGKYMAVGLSGEDDRSVMVGGDAMIGWFDQNTSSGNVVDYHLGGKSACQSSSNSLSSGSCPDVRFKEGANNIRLLSAASVNGFTILTFQRKLKALDSLDKRIRTNESQPIIWAIGSILNDVAGYHDVRNGDDISLDFGRTPVWNCPEPQKEPEFMTTTRTPDVSNIVVTTSPAPILVTTGAPIAPPKKVSGKGEQEVLPLKKENNPPAAWRIPPIPCHEPDDGVYYLHLGPIGPIYGRKDIFKAVTGKQDPPPIVWYVNGLLMPEIYLVRNKNYTFVVQGGENGFYITDNEVGDFQHSSHAKQEQAGIFAGVEFDSQGNAHATALGKLCRWVENGNQPKEGFASYAAYQRTLSLECGKGHSGLLHFTPNKDTPDLVYYQSFSRQNMGWKIHVLDHCGKHPSPTVPPQILHVDQNIEESQQGATFLRPSSIMMNDMPPQYHQHVPMKAQQVQIPHHSVQQPIQNAYIIDTSMAGSGSFPNLQQFNGRFIFKGNKPLEPQSQGSQNRQSILALGSGNSFSLPQTPGLFQMTLDGDSDNLAGRLPQPVFQQPGGFQQMPETHFSRRTGPQQYQQNQQSPTFSPSINSNYKYQPLPSSYDRMVEGGGGGGYFEGKSEYFSGPTRSPSLMSVPGGRYENQPPPQIIYATTISPRRYGGLPFMTHESSSPPDMIMRNQPNSPSGGRGVQSQNGPRRPQMDFQPHTGIMMNHENVQFKYLDHPPGGLPPGKIMQNDGRHNAPPIWVHTRNLPKRESGRDVSIIRKGILREGLRRVTRDFPDFNMNEPEEKTEMEKTEFLGQLKEDVNSQEVGKSDKNLENFSKDIVSMSVVEKRDGENFPGEESEAVQLISVAHQEDNDSKRNFSNNPSKHQHPVLESFFEPVFRPSPPDQKGPNDIMAKLNQIKNQLGPDSPPTNHPLSVTMTSPHIYHYQKNGVLEQQEKYQTIQLPPLSFSLQQKQQQQRQTSSPISGMYRRPIKLQLRELLRQPSLIPQLLAFRNPGRVREFVKLSSSPIEPTTGMKQQSHSGMRQVHVHNGHKEFRPRNDQIAQPQQSSQHSAPPSFPIVPAVAVDSVRIQNPDNVSFISFEEDDVDEGAEIENYINGGTKNVKGRDDKIIPESTTTNKANNNQEQDQQLSLTLLTDVWQIINQQGISLQPTRKQHPMVQHNLKQQYSNYFHRIQAPGKLASSGNMPHKMIIKGQRNMIQILGFPFFRKHGVGRGMANLGRELVQDGDDGSDFENEDAAREDSKESDETTDDSVLNITHLPNH